MSVPTSQADVLTLRQRNASVVTLAERALAAFWATLDLNRPESALDALLEFMPQLVAQYGDLAATVAADWYETVRGRDVAGSFNAILASATPAEQVQRNVRYQATPLFSGVDPEFMLQTLGGAVQLHVVNMGRETIRSNAVRDPAKPRYARVPTGAKTCAFCSLLASRGFVYATESAAGEFDKYHHLCDCQAVADFSDDPRIDGYHPDELYDLYRSARAASGASDIKSIVYEARRQFPDRFTDGVVNTQ